MLIGIATDPIWRRRYDGLVRASKAQGGDSEPEFRLPSTILGAFVVPVALFGKLLQDFDVHHVPNHDSCRFWVDHVSICKYWI